MIKILQIAAKIRNPWSFAAFAMGLIVFFVLRARLPDVPVIAWIVMLVIFLVGIVAPFYLEKIRITTRSKAIYRVRVTVVDPDQRPVEDAKVWSSMGGEPKKVAGGWQFDIPSSSKPKDGKLTIFATKPSAFLKGTHGLQLKDDYNPTLNIQLEKDTSASVRGIVTDDSGKAVEGSRVSIVGYGSEGVTTEQDGNFALAAHAAEGEQVQLHVEREGYGPVTQWHPAGDESATIVLRHK